VTPEKGSVRFELYQQFTDFEQVSDLNGVSIREGEFTTKYSSVQGIIGYDLTSRWGMQLNVPFIYRRYEQYTNYRRTTGSESGLGDMTLSVDYTPIADFDPSGGFRWSFHAGVELPTGDTGSIEAQQSGRVNGSNAPAVLRHHTGGTVSGGRILSLGSGSYDFPIGTALLWRADQYFVLSSLQYTFRTEGDFDYKFGNDLVAELGPGVFVALHDDYTTALRVVFSSEYKWGDDQNSSEVDYTKVYNLFLGPQVIVTASDHLIMQIGVDLPVYRDESDTTIIPRWRMRAGVTYRL